MLFGFTYAPAVFRTPVNYVFRDMLNKPPTPTPWVIDGETY